MSGNYNNGTSVSSGHSLAMKSLKNAIQSYWDLEEKLYRENTIKNDSGRFQFKSQDAYRSYLNDPRRSKASARLNKALSQMSKVVLSDIGFEDNSELRGLIPYIFDENFD